CVHDKDSVVDEALLTVMRAPKSYTREDAVEISCHGGVIPLRKSLGLVLERGARLAEPGEFTKRAFINGRLDLTQAEAVLDIIRAKTDASLRAAISQLDGRLSSGLNKIKDELISISANIEGSIDFPDEDIEIISEAKIGERLGSVKEEVRRLLETAERGIILREGISCVICGKPNVGKSSMLNALVGRERAIVTHIPGTTRDPIEEFINILGIPFRLADTAGIVPTEDIVEREGVLRSREHIEAADLVLLVLDASSRLTDEDRVLLEDTKGRQRIIVLNKIDLSRKISLAASRDETVAEVSAKSGEGIDGLKDKMSEKVFGGGIRSTEGAIITNARQKDALRRSYESLAEAIRAVDGKLSPELIAIELKESLDCIGEIAGETVTDDILDKVFSQFCIGK
ncbi:MAG: tRNA uridine-5-carboxymethylaminomethyl(34) synthesis GTPase MnmE, partial [Candidatus Omnitrophica bacterium]|nr:tRNA uridine-5-carboxymethylaminomethyl(34) synthesis GTPase MnmE [Candidatus Omnitrophota bacterium]